MRSIFISMIVGMGLVSLLHAQMLGEPSAAPASPQTSQVPTLTEDNSQKTPAQQASQDEPANPRLFGMEIPLLDPASDTIMYNGAKFDVGNNAAVRAKFETYLHSIPETSEQTRVYTEKINNIIHFLRKHHGGRKLIGSSALIEIGKTLYSLSNVPIDGNLSGVLASSIVSALDVQRANRSREIENKQILRELDRLARMTNNQRNQATTRKTPNGYNDIIVEYNKSKMAEGTAARVENKAKNVATDLSAKISYQSNMVAFLMARRFDHAIMAARAYRHVFHDGDSEMKIDEESDAGKLLKGTTGLPPTVNTVDTLANEARVAVDKHMDAVHSMLAQNKLGEATRHLIEAVAVGEHMIKVLTFPAESRKRIAEYWTLRKRSISALNARDYATVDEVARKMKELDVDFDDSMLLSYSAGKKRESDFCLRNARKALLEGKDEEFNRYLTEAGTIWPLNPLLEESAKHLEQFDNNELVHNEFRALYARGEYRTIFNEQARFESVATDTELKQQYKEVILFISTIDAMLKQLESVAAQDRGMGPCVAYETLMEYKDTEPRSSQDSVFKDALNAYAQQAHDFVQALNDAAACVKRREYGSALSNYYRAQCLYPKSKLAARGAAEVAEIIVNAQY